MRLDLQPFTSQSEFSKHTWPRILPTTFGSEMMAKSLALAECHNATFRPSLLTSKCLTNSVRALKHYNTSNY